jgi:hypothetical protein
MYGLGAGASIVGGSIILAFSGLPPGVFAMFVVGLVVATSVIVTRRLCWSPATGETP